MTDKINMFSLKNNQLENSIKKLRFYDESFFSLAPENLQKYLLGKMAYDNKKLT